MSNPTGFIIFKDGAHTLLISEAMSWPVFGPRVLFARSPRIAVSLNKEVQLSICWPFQQCFPLVCQHASLIEVLVMILVIFPFFGLLKFCLSWHNDCHNFSASPISDCCRLPFHGVGCRECLPQQHMLQTVPLLLYFATEGNLPWTCQWGCNQWFPIILFCPALADLSETWPKP